jgi:CubicO group peptidase (beta-lactamase class C family)
MLIWPVAQSTAASAQDERSRRCREELRPLVEATMTQRGVPGVIVFVSVPNVCEWIARLGVDDVVVGRPMRRDDHVRVGSITKTFTGTVVLQLVDEGLVVLDNPISRYLTRVPNGQNITVRQLLNMTSGLYNYSDDLVFNMTLDKQPDKEWTRDELLNIAFSHSPYFLPGQGFHYSNTNSVLLGLLVETITGRHFENEVESRIFRPLGLRGTSLPRSARIPSPRSRGYQFGTNVGTLVPPECDAETAGRRDATADSPSWTWSAGGAISTLPDLKIWARALAIGTLLTPTTQAERLDWVPTGPPPAPRYGLHITDFAGVIGHDGALLGYQSFMGYLPARDATLVVLANVFPDAECGSPADEIAKVILRQLQLLALPDADPRSESRGTTGEPETTNSGVQ